jgi:hypothetical protein
LSGKIFRNITPPKAAPRMREFPFLAGEDFELAALLARPGHSNAQLF